MATLPLPRYEITPAARAAKDCPLQLIGRGTALHASLDGSIEIPDGTGGMRTVPLAQVRQWMQHGWLTTAEEGS